MRGHSVVLAALMNLMPIIAHGAPDSYYCEVISHQAPPQKGGEDLEWVGETAKEQAFTIDRKTGRVIHPVLGNANALERIILTSGDSSSRFRLLSRWPSGEGMYVEVQEFEEGPRKPFIAVLDMRAYFGFCL